MLKIWKIDSEKFSKKLSIPYPVSRIPYPLLKKEEKIETIEKHSFIMYFWFIECNSFVTVIYKKYTLSKESIQETQLFYKGYKVFQDFSEIFKNFSKASCVLLFLKGYFRKGMDARDTRDT